MVRYLARSFRVLDYLADKKSKISNTEVSTGLMSALSITKRDQQSNYSILSSICHKHLDVQASILQYDHLQVNNALSKQTLLN